MATDDVVVRFGGSIENLTAAVDAARGSIESLAAPFTGLTSTVGAFGEAFAAAFAVREVAHFFAESMADLGTQTARASQILGVSTEEVGALKLVAKASGNSLEELQTEFGQLSRNVIDETPNAKRALDALGLSFSDLRNKIPEAQLELLASKFASIKDGADNAIEIELLGRGAVNLIPVFNQGAEGIRHWKELAAELGVTLDEVAAGKMEAHASLDHRARGRVRRIENRRVFANAKRDFRCSGCDGRFCQMVAGRPGRGRRRGNWGESLRWRGEVVSFDLCRQPYRHQKPAYVHGARMERRQKRGHSLWRGGQGCLSPTRRRHCGSAGDLEQGEGGDRRHSRRIRGDCRTYKGGVYLHRGLGHRQVSCDGCLGKLRRAADRIGVWRCVQERHRFSPCG